MSRNAIVHQAGERYGKYVLVKRVENKYAQQRWLCRCDCGTERVLVISAVVHGHSKSCGCASGDFRKQWHKVNGMKKGQMMRRGQLVDATQWISPRIELKSVKADRSVPCKFCGRNGFSQSDSRHIQIYNSDDNVLNLCYGCAMAIGDRLWKRFMTKDYSKVVNCRD